MDKRVADDPVIMTIAIDLTRPLPLFLPTVDGVAIDPTHPDYAVAVEVRDFCAQVWERVCIDDATLGHVYGMVETWLDRLLQEMQPQPFYCTPTSDPPDEATDG